MRAFVFTDKSLAGQAGRYVWLSIDTEKSSNAAFLKRYTIEGVPTFFILDPSGRVALRWLGSLTLPQLVKLLDDGEAAVGGGQTAAAKALARADRLYGEGKNAEAAAAYEEALTLAPRGWPPYRRAVDTLLWALSGSEEKGRCAAFARAFYPQFRNTSSAANIAGVGLDCAVGMKEGLPERGELIDVLRADAREVLANPKVVVAADDRSGLYISLLSERQAANDAEGAKKVAQEWSAFLDAQARAAKTPGQRVVFDSHRLSAYLELGEPERAIPMLEASERDFPDDYNPPARLAIAYNAMKKFDLAIAASDRALARAYGPRKLGILRTRADIQVGMGKPEAAKETLRDAIRLAESLPEGQRSERTIEGLKKRLAAMEKPDTAGK